MYKLNDMVVLSPFGQEIFGCLDGLFPSPIIKIKVTNDSGFRWIDSIYDRNDGRTYIPIRASKIYYTVRGIDQEFLEECLQLIGPQEKLE